MKFSFKKIQKQDHCGEVDLNNILIAVRYLDEDRNHHRPTARKMVNQREQAELGK
jgi:hypothetical protein